MKKSKAILLLALVFFAGFVGGVATTRLVVRHFITQAIQRPELVRDRLERVLARRLDLTPSQRATLHEELGKAQARVKALRQEFQPRMAAIVGDLRDAMEPLLTPEQRKRLEELQRENRRLFEP